MADDNVKSYTLFSWGRLYPRIVHCLLFIMWGGEYLYHLSVVYYAGEIRVIYNLKRGGGSGSGSRSYYFCFCVDKDVCRTCF